jgi:NAD(P)-dependent dehydrogenase (short-subunit alcohol dehydrogenase family)
LKAAIIAGNQTSLLQRFIEPMEIANLALYLASPLASATNGAAVRGRRRRPHGHDLSSRPPEDQAPPA